MAGLVRADWYKSTEETSAISGRCHRDPTPGNVADYVLDRLPAAQIRDLARLEFIAAGQGIIA